MTLAHVNLATDSLPVIIPVVYYLLHGDYIVTLILNRPTATPTLEATVDRRPFQIHPLALNLMYDSVYPKLQGFLAKQRRTPHSR